MTTQAIRDELRALLESHAHEAAQLDVAAMQELLPVLQQARTELNRDLAAWIASGKGDARYTPQAYRSSLLAIEAATDAMRTRITPALLHTLGRHDAIARRLASTQTGRELQLLAQAGFSEIMPDLPTRVAAGLITSRGAPMRRYETSAARYAADIAHDIRRELAVGVVRGESLSALVDRMQRIGGPSGAVAVQGIAGTPGAVIEVIPEGLFRRYEYWAERLVRTELAHAHNEQLQDIATDLRRTTTMTDMARRWDATADGRLCARCQDMHGALADPVTDMFPNGVIAPPLHPNCRCRAGLWRPSWERFMDRGYIDPGAPRVKTLPPPPAPKPKAPRKPRAPRVPTYTVGSPPPRTFASAADAEAWGAAAHPHIQWDLEGIAPELLGDLLTKFHELATDWPEVAAQFEYVGTYHRQQGRWSWSSKVWGNDRTYAHATRNGRELAFNPHWFGRPDVLRNALANDVASRWHPAGTDDPVSIMTHEFGHQVEAWLQRTPNRSFLPFVHTSGFGLSGDTYRMFAAANRATAALSQYATTDAAEGWAESFAAIHHSPRRAWTEYTRRQNALLEHIRRATRDPGTLPSFSTYTRHMTQADGRAEFDALRKLAKSMGITL